MIKLNKLRYFDVSYRYSRASWGVLGYLGVSWGNKTDRLTDSQNYWWSSELPCVVLFPAGVFCLYGVGPKLGKHTPAVGGPVCYRQSL